MLGLTKYTSKQRKNRRGRGRKRGYLKDIICSQTNSKF
jgi:hypothetical protein